MTVPAETTRKRKRYCIASEESTTKFAVSSDYEDTDSEYGRLYDIRIDEIIARNLKKLEDKKRFDGTVTLPYSSTQLINR